MTQANPKLAPLLLPFLVLVACGSDPAGDSPLEYGPPDAPGPLAVGVTTLEVDDGQGTGRQLPVEVWYPADPSGQGTAVSYSLEVDGLVVASEPSPAGALRDVPADDTDAPYPVIVFSHGNGGLRTQSFYLAEHLASHGFVVVAPDHVGNTLETTFHPELALPTLEVARLRPLDVGRALDAVLLAGETAAHPLAGVVDPERVGMAGHSFGGYTALRIAGATLDPATLEALCGATAEGFFCDGWDTGTRLPASQRDTRFDVALAMAPAGSALLDGGYADVAVPTMLQHGDADQTTPLASEGELPFSQLPAPAWMVVVADAGHYNFADSCRLVEAALPQFADLVAAAAADGCSPENIDWVQAHRISQGYAAAFFHTELAHRGDYATWLDTEPDLAGVARVEVH